MAEEKKAVSFRFPPEFTALLARIKAQEKLSYTTIIRLAVEEWAKRRGIK
jgi:hypothetical protein